MLLFNNLLWIGIEPHIDPRIILHLLLQMISHIPIKSPQEQIATIHQCHITPQSIHNTRKLQGNESSAHDNNPLGLLFQIEYLVGSDGVFDSGNVVGFEGPSAHGNEDIFGGDGGCLARGGGVDGDGVGTVEGSRGFDDLDAGVFEYKVLVDVVESSDFLVLFLQKDLPIECPLGGTLPAIAFHLLDFSGISTGKDHELFGYASNIDTRPPNRRIFRRDPMLQSTFQ
mmetsp:Transcript_16621/g.29292  ORF Transcript_16621/g.29292 Transcript_16621/m.29292 type:complete len:227 (+) Transcript_16621:375-1055(+)